MHYRNEMRESIQYRKECLVYPGEYIPMPQAEKQAAAISSSRWIPSVLPTMNLDEFNNLYRLTVIAPGVRREDIFIHVHQGRLKILILSNDQFADMSLDEEINRKMYIHEFESAHQQREILLPEDAETEFMSAEYHDGILLIQIPKSQDRRVTEDTQIVVY